MRYDDLLANVVRMKNDGSQFRDEVRVVSLTSVHHHADDVPLNRKLVNPFIRARLSVSDYSLERSHDSDTKISVRYCRV